jgi:hypothetical protein
MPFPDTLFDAGKAGAASTEDGSTDAIGAVTSKADVWIGMFNAKAASTQAMKRAARGGSQ